MRLNSNVPKTFSIFVKVTEDKSGYVRYKSYLGQDGISYSMTLVKNIKDSSKYVNFDNVKRVGRKMNSSGKYLEVKVVDDKIMKFYNVGNHEKKQS